MKNKRTPDIRFAGFTGDWEQRKLKDILIEKISNGMMNRPGKNQLGVKNINVVNLYSPSYIHEDELEYIDATEKEVYKYNVEVGDIFLTRSSLKVEGIAQANILLALGTYVFDDHIMRMKLNKGYSNFFVKEMLNHNYVKKQFMSKSKTGTMTTIGQEDISSSYGIFPSFREQEKIGSFLFQIDKLITLQQQELTNLKKTKQGFLQKMFPKEGESVPEVRFPGFTVNWEEHKLGEIMDVTSVKRIHQADWTDKGVRFLRARDIVAASKNEEPSDYLYISVDKYNEYSKVSGKVSRGDLLVTGVGSIGVPMLVTDDNPIYFKDGNIIWFKNNHRIEGNFFYYSFKNNKIQRYIRDVAGIGTVGTYTIDSGKKTPISLPSFEEQIKIGNFFKQLDDTISLHQRELDALKETKKAFLQKMFA